MAPFFANHSCDPFAAESSPCIIGVYVRYAIDVTEPQDISIGLAFAQLRNIRLVIRNTGHEYVGVLSLLRYPLRVITLTRGYFQLFGQIDR